MNQEPESIDEALIEEGLALAEEGMSDYAATLRAADVDTPDITIAQRKSLEALVVDNAELEQLESLLDQFNIFEAIGMTRQEIKHSHFLAFLLDPQEKHGLGDAFAKRLLQKVLLASEESSLPVTLIDLDIWSLNASVVQREWQNIDILITDETNKLAVIIENKVDSGEHSNQLDRYWKIVQQHYPGWKVIGLFLTREGETPLHKEYLPINYKIVCDLVKEVAERRASVLGTDIHTLMLHYEQMLRRHIVSETEIAKLCQRIYRKHKQALDLVFEHRPDQQLATKEVVYRLIKEQPTLTADRGGKVYIGSAPKEWDSINALNQGQGWVKSGRLLMFDFENNEKSLRLKLYIGPGSAAAASTRQQLLKMANDAGAPLKPNARLGAKWSTIYQRDFLKANHYEDMTAEEREEHLHKEWSDFIQGDLPRIQQAVAAQNFQ